MQHNQPCKLSKRSDPLRNSGSTPPGVCQPKATTASTHLTPNLTPEHLLICIPTNIHDHLLFCLHILPSSINTSSHSQTTHLVLGIVLRQCLMTALQHNLHHVMFVHLVGHCALGVCLVCEFQHYVVFFAHLCTWLYVFVNSSPLPSTSTRDDLPRSHLILPKMSLMPCAPGPTTTSDLRVVAPQRPSNEAP